MNSYSNQEMCRMSWFLVELESNPKSYSIIHLVDLVVEDSTNIYIDRKVQFYRDTRTLSGIIIAASDDRKCIETLRKLMSLDNDNNDQEKWLLVQHCKGNNNLVHSVINKNEITLHPDQKYQKRQVYINCNNVQRPATILCICDTEEQNVIELQCLKKRCFDVAFDDSQSPAKQNSSIPTKTHRTKSSKILAHSTPKLSNDVNDSKLLELMSLGPNGTMISKDAVEAINWSSPAVATRKLLMEVFDRETLAFHTLTGKPSPAFIDCDKPLKNKLDPLKVEDIIDYVTKNSNASSKDVRSAITTKCADENKMYRQREKKRKSLNKSNKENILIVNC